MPENAVQSRSRCARNEASAGGPRVRDGSQLTPREAPATRGAARFRRSDGSSCTSRRSPSSLPRRNQEGLGAVAVPQRLSHPDLALATVVVPAIVEEGDAALDGPADDADALGRI